MVGIFNKVSGLFGSHKQVERTKAPGDERPIETRAAKARGSHSLASAFSIKHKSVKSRKVSTASPEPKPNPAKTSELDPATKLGLKPGEYFSIVAHVEPKIGPMRGKPLEAPARNEATERMLLDIEERDVDGELEKLIRGLDEEVFAPVDPRIMDTLPKAELEQAGKTVHRPEPTANWPDQLEVPARRDFNSVANDTRDAIDRAEIDLLEQLKLQSAYDEAVRATVGQPKDNRMPEMQRKVSDDYADFEWLLKQHDTETEQDVKDDIDWTLMTEEFQRLGPNAAYREIERMIDPNLPRSQDQTGEAPDRQKLPLEQVFERRRPTIGNNRQKQTE